ncbi:CbrC family protein [Streptomyces sp. NPDC057963]|uniref:CbrC family protein n=1 Tax=Streptomyces sp. NPDC057963 TaxID=3346290 RepID=UPI0036E63F18
MHQVTRRTPGFRARQDPHRLVHCHDADAFIGEVGYSEPAAQSEALDRLRQGPRMGGRHDADRPERLPGPPRRGGHRDALPLHHLRHPPRPRRRLMPPARRSGEPPGSASRTNARVACGGSGRRGRFPQVLSSCAVEQGGLPCRSWTDRIS